MTLGCKRHLSLYPGEDVQGTVLIKQRNHSSLVDWI